MLWSQYIRNRGYAQSADMQPDFRFVLNRNLYAIP